MKRQQPQIGSYQKISAPSRNINPESNLADAIYNMSVEEMIRAVEPDSTFRPVRNGPACGQEISATVSFYQWLIYSHKLLKTACCERLTKEKDHPG